MELAPYQRTAIQNQEKSDLKCGDIVNTDEYKHFCEGLEKKKDHVVTSNAAKVQANLAALEKTSPSEQTITPLMEFLQSNRGMEEEQQQAMYARPRGRKERNRERKPKRSDPYAAADMPAKPVLLKRREVAPGSDTNTPVLRGKNSPGGNSESRPSSGKGNEKGRRDGFAPAATASPTLIKVKVVRMTSWSPTCLTKMQAVDDFFLINLQKAIRINKQI